MIFYFVLNQVANEIRDEDHAGNAEIKLIGKMMIRAIDD